MQLRPGQQDAMGVLQQRQTAGTLKPRGMQRLQGLQAQQAAGQIQPMRTNPAGHQMPPNSNSFQAGQAQGALRPQPLQRLDAIRSQQMGQGLAGLGQAHPAYGMSGTLPPPQSPGLQQMAGQMERQPLTPEQLATQEQSRAGMITTQEQGRAGMNANGVNRPQIMNRAKINPGGQGGTY